MCKRLSRTLETTRFAGAPIVAVAAKPGGPDAPETETATGIETLVEVCMYWSCISCLSVCPLSICQSVCMPACRLSVCLSVRPSVCLSVVCLPVCLSVHCPSVRLSACLSSVCLSVVCLPVHLFVCPSICLSVCPSVCPPVCLMHMPTKLIKTFLLAQVLSQQVFIPSRSPSGPFIFSVDHCFPIRGQGTVMTGTVLSGSVGINDVSIPSFPGLSSLIAGPDSFQTHSQGVT